MRDYSILNEVKPDCFNLIESITTNGFTVFYLDDKGNKEHQIDLYSFNDASEYLILLIKSLKK